MIQRSIRRLLNTPRPTSRTMRARHRTPWVVVTLVAGAVTALSCGNEGSDGGLDGSGGSGESGGTNTGATSSGGAPTGGTTAGGGTSGGTSSGGALGTGGASGGAPSSSGGNSTGGSAGGGTGGAGPVACDASSAPGVGRLGLETVVTSDKLQALVYAAQPPGSDDWYLVDIMGSIWVAVDGVVSDTPFLDLTAEVQNLDFSYDERGLLSLAFPPDYETSGKFYVALIPTSTATEDHDLVLEFVRSSADPLVADPTTRKALIDLAPRGEDPTAGAGVDLNKFHNASTVAFGPDGMLYVGMGDGGGQCNSAIPGAPQDISSPYGKILRLDPNAPAPDYAAAGNPFATEGDPRVLHYGIRNPFRFSFDPATGDLYFGEVGQWAFEEISYAPADAQGINFGWPAFEANQATPHANCQTSTTLREGSTHTPPIYSIAHGTASGAGNLIVAVVGGTVYRGSAIPELEGAYLFGEYYANRNMYALVQCGDQTSEVLTIRKACDANFPNDSCFVPQSGAPALGEVGAIVTGNDGELYMPANGNTLLKIVPAE